MKILLVNDDGIFAEGIKTLSKVLSIYNHNLIVVAPKAEMSSVGHHLSMRTPIRVEEIENYGAKAYAIEGTPVDCVKFAMHHMCVDVDIVISGINRGANVGSDVVYSGTVSAAIEANILGVPSIAVSSVSYDDNDYFNCAEFIAKNLDKLYQAAQPDKVINVNLPDSTKTKIKGIKIAKQGIRDYGDHYVQVGNDFYIKGTPKCYADIKEETDVKYLDAGYITITPLTYSMSDFSSFHKLEEFFK